MSTANHLSSVVVASSAQPSASDALLERLLGLTPDQDLALLDRLLHAPITSDAALRAPQLRPTGRKTVCTAQPAPRELLRPALRLATLSLLAGTLIALSAGAPIAQAVYPAADTVAAPARITPAGRSAVAAALSVAPCATTC
ncbi:MAG: hypothetical protein HC822_27615 [Oscillochloris sp.]|nr:hypothetical protein [Oscillochloris sp.]